MENGYPSIFVFNVYNQMADPQSIRLLNYVFQGLMPSHTCKMEHIHSVNIRIGEHVHLKLGNCLFSVVENRNLFYFAIFENSWPGDKGLVSFIDGIVA